jgi:hypothetical protein
VALTISPQQIARDRGFVERAFAARSIGRTMIDQRRNLRAPGQQRQPGLRQPNNRQPNLRQPGQQPRQGTLPLQRPAGQPGTQGQPRSGNAPNPQRPNLQQNPQRQNLQRQNLQQRPAAPGPRQPARRKPPGNTPPPR